MKYFYLIIAFALLSTNFSYGQWITTGNNIYYPNGKVSIGTNYPPYYDLEVHGSFGLGLFDNYGNGLTASGSGLTYYPNQYSDGFFNLQPGYIWMGDYAGDLNQTIIRVEDGISKISGIAFGGYNFIGGPFGVNSSTPISNFQVNDGAGMLSGGTAGGSGLNYGTSYMGFNAARSGTNWTINGDGSHNGGGVIYNGILDGAIYFAPIANTGVNSQTLTDLDIKSRITFRITPTATYAKQLIVELTGWPDYVFDKNYQLKPLSEVKNYIDQNHHLPDMPSAEAMAKDGVNVSEMNKILTKKIEELTLYLMEKDEEIKIQEDKNKAQVLRMNADENLIKQQNIAMEAINKRLQALENK